MINGKDIRSLKTDYAHLTEIIAITSLIVKLMQIFGQLRSVEKMVGKSVNIHKNSDASAQALPLSDYCKLYIRKPMK